MSNRNFSSRRRRPLTERDAVEPKDGSTIQQILRKCSRIESQVASLCRLESENSRLVASLGHAETNFLNLLKVSQTEIQKLKRSGQNGRKGLPAPVKRNICLRTLDLHKLVDQEDLVEYLHTSQAYEFVKNGSHISISRAQRHYDAVEVDGDRSSSSSMDSSSTSSTSSSSSLSSSPLSPLQKEYLLKQKLSQISLRSSIPVSQETAVISPTKATQSVVDKPRSISKSPRNNVSVSHLNHRSFSKTKPISMGPQCDAQTKISDAETPVHNKDASTGLTDDMALHLSNLVRTSVRSAREHHAFSIRNAPPRRGVVPDERTKAAIEAYFQAEENRCMEAAERRCSESPLSSLSLATENVFTLRQKAKCGSLSGKTSAPTPAPPQPQSSFKEPSSLSPRTFPSSSLDPTATTNASSECHTKSSGSAPNGSADSVLGKAVSSTPPCPMTPVSSPHWTAAEGEPSGPPNVGQQPEGSSGLKRGIGFEEEEEEEVYDESGSDVAPETKQPGGAGKNEADVEQVTEDEDEVIDVGSNGKRRLSEPSPVDIEDAVSNIDSQNCVEEGEAMSEGEVNSEEDDRTANNEVRSRDHRFRDPRREPQGRSGRANDRRHYRSRRSGSQSLPSQRYGMPSVVVRCEPRRRPQQERRERRYSNDHHHNEVPRKRLRRGFSEEAEERNGDGGGKYDRRRPPRGPLASSSYANRQGGGGGGKFSKGVRMRSSVGRCRSPRRRSFAQRR